MSVAAVLALSGALALSGCTQNSDTAGPATQTTAAKAAKVDDIAATAARRTSSRSGKLIVGVNVPYTPNEFKDPSGKIIGFDVDLMNAIASTLGLTADYRESDFAKIIPAIQGGTFNVGMSSFTDTKEREASVDFVTYFSAGSLWARPKGSDIGPENACGKKVAVQATTTQEADELPGRSKACTDAGKPAIEILKFDGQDRRHQRGRPGPGRRDVGGLAGDPVRDQAEQRQTGAGGPDLRFRTLRLAGEEGLTAGGVDAEGSGAPDRDRRLQADRQQLGCRGRHDRQAGHQRRDQLIRIDR